MNMFKKNSRPWDQKIVSADYVLEKVEPGMNIFLGTGVAEPRTLVKRLMASDKGNLQDLALIQLVSLGDALAIEERYSYKYRLKTFFSGWVASDAITEGRVDLIPCRFSRIPSLISSGKIQVDAAFVQITPPDRDGYASLGAAVDVARQAMEQASLVVGEINEQAPRTLGDTFVHVNDFHYFVKSTEPIIYFPRWPVDEVYDKVAAHVATMVEDGSCIAFSVGPLFEALGKHLVNKRNLGIHSPFFTDALMELVKSGAVTNRKKGVFRGKCLAAYAFGTRELMQWLNENPLVEFQGIDVVADPHFIGHNEHFILILPARKVDLSGRIAMHAGRGNVAATPGEAQEFFLGAASSPGGRTIFALPSRNLMAESNILLSVDGYPNQFTIRESLDLVVTEYGVASLTGRSIRERALALIDIAHPDHRKELVRQAKEHKILYPDQIYLTESGHLYPDELTCVHTFKEGLSVRFRAIKPSDEEEMRQLFYRFSDESVYYRYFTGMKTMPHSRMQEYVNIDYRKTMSIVGLVGEPGAERIIAEARYVTVPERPYGDIAMVVDEAYHGRGIATFLLHLLFRVAEERGLQGFTADVLIDNKPMWKVLEKSPYPRHTTREAGYFHVTIPFTEAPSQPETK